MCSDLILSHLNRHKGIAAVRTRLRREQFVQCRLRTEVKMGQRRQRKGLLTRRDLRIGAISLPGRRSFSDGRSGHRRAGLARQLHIRKMLAAATALKAATVAHLVNEKPVARPMDRKSTRLNSSHLG